MTGTTGSSVPFDNRQPTIVGNYIISLQGMMPDGTPSASLTTTPDRSNPYLGEIKAIPFDYANTPAGWALCDGQLLSISANTALYSLLGTKYGGNGTTNFALPDLRGRVPIGAGQGPGLPNYDVGQAVGDATPELTIANLPAHQHAIPGGLTAAAGSGTPVDNRQPVLAVNFYISGDGEILIAAWSTGTSEWMACDGRLLSIAANTTLFSNIGTAYGGNGSSNFAIPDLRGRVVIGDDAASWYVGDNYGSNDVTLSVSNIPSHTHSLTSGNTAATGGPGNSASNYQPSTVLRWLICLDGIYPDPFSTGVQFPMIGELRLIAGQRSTGLPEDVWEALDGTLYQIANYDQLFTLLGTTFGGDGQNTFGVPDFRGRVAEDSGGSTTLGETLGTSTLNISVAKLAAHAHLLMQLQITGIEHFGDGSAQLTLAGTVGNTAQVEYSSDLLMWTNLGAVAFTSGTMTFPDANSLNAPKRFYHAYFP